MSNAIKLNHYLEQIKDRSPDFAGREVRAFLVDKDKRVFKKFRLTCFLENLNDAILIENRLHDLKRNVDVVRSKGVNTPEIVEVFRRNKEVFTLEERAPGDPMFILKPFSIAKRANMATDKYDVTPVGQFEADRMVPASIARKGKKFINQALQVLTTAPQEHYDKLVRDVIAISKTDKLGLDMYAENVLYDRKTGFHLIDLDLCYSPKTRISADYVNVQICLNPLANVNHFWESVARGWLSENIHFVLDLGKIVEKVLLGCVQNGIFNFHDKEERDRLAIQIFDLTARWKFLNKFEEKYKDILTGPVKR